MPEVWYWSPNRLSETLQFSTQVFDLRALEGRVSYMDAVQQLAFGFIVDPAQAEEMTNLYLSDPNQTFLVPEWPTATINSTTSVSASDTTIPVADDVVYAVGQQVIFGAGDLWEIGEVEALNGTSIDLVSGSSAGYTGSSPAPFFVAPLIECILPNGIQSGKFTPIRDVSVEFLSIAPINIAQSTYTTYLGVPLVLDGDFMSGPIPYGAGRSSTLVASGYGAFEIVQTEDYTRRTGQLSWKDATYADRMTRRRFFHFMRGQDGEIWVPSLQDDLTLNAGFANSTIALDIRPSGPSAALVGKHILISEGANFSAREITSVTENSATSVSIQIAAVGFTGSAGAKVSFLTKQRFETDDIQISYQFGGDGLISESTIPTIEVA